MWGKTKPKTPKTEDEKGAFMGEMIRHSEHLSFWRGARGGRNNPNYIESQVNFQYKHGAFLKSYQENRGGEWDEAKKRFGIR